MTVKIDFGCEVEMYNLLVEKMNGIHVKLNDRQLQQFHRFYEMLVEWNKVMNLTGITEYDEIVEKHFVDSLSIVNIFELELSLIHI